jgi:hypothetical protein
MKTSRGPYAVLALLALAGCGGGGGGGGPSEVAEPNNTAAQATVLALPGTASQVVGSEDDEDWYRITVPAGGATVRIRTRDASGTTCNNVDTIVGVFSSAVTPISIQDDTPAPTCEDFQISLLEGTNYIAVGGFPSTPVCSGCRIPFAYRLEVSIVP